MGWQTPSSLPFNSRCGGVAAHGCHREQVCYLSRSHRNEFYFPAMKTLIYKLDRETNRNTYWNGCSWTDSVQSARKYSESEAEPVVRHMMVDNIKAKTITINALHS